ncbi:ECF transporter S component [Proteiniborus sp.]|uniref:ECF transporter S component n=1 Tax=Proteiniborus sp. TaxID=2079015 RepID=UPI00331B5A56
MDNVNVRKLTYGGLMTALVFVTTAIIPQIPIPFTEGYIHTGDSMIFVTSILLGWKYGLFAGGVGSAMADLFLGYAHWALPTLIIKGIMGAIVGLMAQDVNSHKLKTLRSIISYTIGIGWVGTAIYFKTTLYNISSNLENSEVAGFLVEKLSLDGTQQLESLINSVQLSLMFAAIIIPVFIVVLSIILKKKDKELFSMNSLMGMTLAGLWMVVGYYIAGGILKGNMIIPMFSVPANIIQFIGGAVIAFPIILALKKSKVSTKISSRII